MQETIIENIDIFNKSYKNYYKRKQILVFIYKLPFNNS